MRRCHPDWTLEFGDAPIQTLFTGATFGGFYAIEIRPNAPHQALLIALRQSSAKAYRAGAIQAISFQLYSGSQALNPNDLEVSIVGSRAFQYWSPDEVASLGAATNSFLSPYDAVFPPRTLAQLGITETVPPQTWVKVSYSLTQNNPTTTYDWLTGFYVENGSNFVSPYVIDDVRFLLTDE